MPLLRFALKQRLKMQRKEGRKWLFSFVYLIQTNDQAVGFERSENTHQPDVRCHFLISSSEPAFPLGRCEDRLEVLGRNQRRELPKDPFPSGSALHADHVVAQAKFPPVFLREDHLLEADDLPRVVGRDVPDFVLNQNVSPVSPDVMPPRMPPPVVRQCRCLRCFPFHRNPLSEHIYYVAAV